MDKLGQPVRRERNRLQLLLVTTGPDGSSALMESIRDRGHVVRCAHTCRDAQVIDAAFPCDVILVEIGTGGAVGLAPAIDLLGGMRLRRRKRTFASIAIVADPRTDHAGAALYGGFDEAVESQDALDAVGRLSTTSSQTREFAQ